MTLNLSSRVTAFLAIALLMVMVIGANSSNLPAEAKRSTEIPLSTVRIGVLGLFHAKEFRIIATTGHALVLQAGDGKVLLENSSGIDSAMISLSNPDVVAATSNRTLRSPAVVIAARNGGPTAMILEIPGKIKREYIGTLELRPSHDALLAILTVDLETAVASVVAAESAPNSPVEALRAQAVAVRSYFVAGRGRHSDFDFCDTTHCQFLREPPADESLVTDAVRSTNGLVLASHDRPFPAMYTRSCSGLTHTPAQLSMPSDGYPYYSVECEYCRVHPARWTSRIPASDALSLRQSNESIRLHLDRRLGWNRIPSNDFTMKKEGGELVLQGTGEGHGIGLCQSGALAMAQRGANFRQILNHYYPNTRIILWSAPASSRVRAESPHR